MSEATLSSRSLNVLYRNSREWSKAEGPFIFPAFLHVAFKGTTPRWWTISMLGHTGRHASQVRKTAPIGGARRYHGHLVVLEASLRSWLESHPLPGWQDDLRKAAAMSAARVARSSAERKLKATLHADARSHIGRLGRPVGSDE